MSHENPYKAPMSATQASAPLPPGRWSIMLLSLIAFQTLVTILYATTMVSHLRHGEISLFTFAVSALASTLLAIGGFMYIYKSRYATYLFLSSALFAALTYLHWRPAFVFTGLIISVCACLVSIITQKRLAQV
jgi:hypothetical protein